MKIKIELDDTFKQPELIIRTAELTDEIQQLVQKASISTQQCLVGFVGNSMQMIEPADLIRFYSIDKKVIAQTLSAEFVVRMRLYELEERFVANPSMQFVRISHSEIVNLKAIKNMDLSLGGTILITLINQEVTYVSRRYVKKIKQALGI